MKIWVGGKVPYTLAPNLAGDTARKELVEGAMRVWETDAAAVRPETMKNEPNAWIRPKMCIDAGSPSRSGADPGVRIIRICVMR